MKLAESHLKRVCQCLVRYELKELATWDGFEKYGSDRYRYSMLAVELLASYKGQRSLLDYYASLKAGTTWKNQFEEVFGITVDDHLR